MTYAEEERERREVERARYMAAWWERVMSMPPDTREWRQQQRELSAAVQCVTEGLAANRARENETMKCPPLRKGEGR